MNALYLGLDISARNKSHVATFAATRDGETLTTGKLTLPELPELLKTLQPIAIGIEYTGRLAERWISSAAESNVPVFIIHSVERKAVNRIQRQSAKTDARDAQAIVQSLWIWHSAERRRNALLPADMFTDAAKVRTAWTLRAILASVDQLTSERAKCKQRASSAHLAGHIDLEQMWLTQADNDLPEKALEGAVAFCQKHFAIEYNAIICLPGVGERIATYAISTLLPIDRFPTVAKVLRYVGLHAIKNNSGDRDIERPRLPYCGHRELRSLLYIGAMSQQKKDNQFGLLYRRLVGRGKRGDTATVAVAAHMLKAIYAVLKRGESREQVQQDAERAAAAPPPGCITQSAYSRKVNISRQAINQQIAAGKLNTVVHNGRKYVLLETAQ